MDEEYTVRIGTPGEVPAQDTDALYALHAQAKLVEDDGAIAYTVPREHDTSWNEGRCTCGGYLHWAEAGYVPWYRICDRCGSGWDLHPVTLYLQPDGSLHDDGPGRSSDPQEAAHRARVVQMIRESVAVHPLADDERKHGAIYGSWSRRGRVYGR